MFIVTIHSTTKNNFNINVIPNPRQRGGAFFSRRVGVRDLVLRHFTGLPSRSNSSVHQSAARSFQPGLRDSTSLSFFGRLQPLISFSRAMANSIFENFSKYTRRSHLYLFVKLPPNPLLCSHTRFSSEAQTPA